MTDRLRIRAMAERLRLRSRDPAAEARERAAALVPRLSGRRVLLLGSNVAGAFGFFDRPALRWQTFYHFDGETHRRVGPTALLPHPSGVNLWWNDPENRGRAARFMRALAREEGLR